MGKQVVNPTWLKAWNENGTDVHDVHIRAYVCSDSTKTVGIAVFSKVRPTGYVINLAGFRKAFPRKNSIDIGWMGVSDAL